MKKLLQALLVFAAKGDVRYYLNGVHVVTTDKAATLEATDGHAALVVKLNWLAGLPAGVDVVVSRDQIEMAVKAYKAIPEFTGLRLGDIALSTVDGRFPDMTRFRSEKQLADKMGVQFELLAARCKALSLITKFGAVQTVDYQMGQVAMSGEFTHGTWRAVVMGARL